jgi:hypothetical protein
MEDINPKEAFIEQALNSIDGIVRAEAPPFFYTRLQAKMQKQEEPSLIIRLLWLFAKPALSVVTLSLFVVLNLVAIKSILNKKQEANVSQSTSEASINSFVQEYDLSVSTLYGDTKKGE